MENKNQAEIFVRKLVKRYSFHNISSTSAQVAYYWVMAFFPFLIFIISLLTYTNISVSVLMSYMARMVPNTLLDVIEVTLHQIMSRKSTTLLSFSVLVSLWSASTAVNALTKGIYLAYNSKYIRPYIQSRITAFVYAILLALLIILVMIGLVFGNALGDYMIKLLNLNKGIFMPIWNLVRLIMPFIALIVILYIIYRFIPRKYIKSGNVWPGVFSTTIGWYVFSLIFSVYIDKYSKYNQLYGSIGGVFVLLIWLYAICIVLLLGAEINALYDEMKSEKVTRKINRFKYN